MRIDRLELRLCRLPLVNFFETSFGRVYDRQFVLARLEKEGLKPAPVADRRTLLRRASADVVGLMPTQ